MAEHVADKPHSLTQSMSWLHTWGSLVCGWLLFAIFLTGSISVFDTEINRWMRPELPQASVSQVKAAQTALKHLSTNFADKSNWSIVLPTERSDELAITAGTDESWRAAPGSSTRQTLDPQTGEVIRARETAGGNFFFRFHFTLHFPRNIGIWIVGFLGMAMLAAIISGVIIHKKIFREFFTFRPNRGQRSWLDAHNATAVLLLPFHIVITYTGLVIFMFIYMPSARDLLTPPEPPVQMAQVQDERSERPAPASYTDIATVLAKAEAVMGELSGFSIEKQGTPQATISVRPVIGNQIALGTGHSVSFNAYTGEVLKDIVPVSNTQLTNRVIVGLHFAQFGGYPMRWLYFICGMLSAFMMAMGLVVFTVKRRPQYHKESSLAQRLYRGIESLNITTIVGVSLGAIAMLWANRLLPVTLADRPQMEINVFFAAIIASFLYSCVRDAAKCWVEQLWLLAVLLILLPVLSLITLGNNSWHDSQLVYLELTCVALGLIAAFAARQAKRSFAATPRRRKTV